MRHIIWEAIATMAIMIGGGASAQVRTIDPNAAISQDTTRAPPPQAAPADRDDADDQPPADAAPAEDAAPPATRSQAAPPPRAMPQDTAPATTQAAQTYHREDLLSAGEGVFGKGAQGLAGILEKVLKDQGEPNAYIAGREASGAFVVGLRYGSGILSHKVEGEMPVYWTGPSVGFDVGGDANKVFVLVYNLYDTGDLYHRFPAGEGHLYFVGGFSASYLRRGNIVLIPIRLGVGVRAGVNVGYMKFRHKNNWMPF